jgi:hypothetical protein
LPAQIEPVQDKNIFMLIINYGDTGSPISTASFQTQDQLGECPPYDGVITITGITTRPIGLVLILTIMSVSTFKTDVTLYNIYIYMNVGFMLKY